MKKLFFYLTLLLLVVILQGCSKDDQSLVWDFVNITARVSVVDSDGNDLIANGTIDTSKITIVSKGKEVGIYSPEEYSKLIHSHSTPIVKPAPTRYNLPMYYGAWVSKDRTTGNLVINIGEYDGGKSVNMQEIIIKWADGTTDKIGFSRSVKIKGQSAKVSMQWYRNGQPVDSGYFEFIR